MSFAHFFSFLCYFGYFIDYIGQNIQYLLYLIVLYHLFTIINMQMNKTFHDLFIFIFWNSK